MGKGWLLSRHWARCPGPDRLEGSVGLVPCSGTSRAELSRAWEVREHTREAAGAEGGCAHLPSGSRARSGSGTADIGAGGTPRLGAGTRAGRASRRKAIRTGKP